MCPGQKFMEDGDARVEVRDGKGRTNMMRVEFTDEELSMMRHILESYLSDLTSEISSTETFSFREDLKKEKNFVMDMLGRITRAAA